MAISEAYTPGSDNSRGYPYSPTRPLNLQPNAWPPLCLHCYKACGCGTFTMLPRVLPINTMFPAIWRPSCASRRCRGHRHLRHLRPTSAWSVLAGDRWRHNSHRSLRKLLDLWSGNAVWEFRQWQRRLRISRRYQTVSLRCHFGSPFRTPIRAWTLGRSGRLTFDWGMSLKIM